MLTCSPTDLRVELFREPGKSLGISIVGGRGMGSRLSNGEVMRGIFIKHILEDSPAGQNRTLKTGDRIVEVRTPHSVKKINRNVKSPSEKRCKKDSRCFQTVCTCICLTRWTGSTSETPATRRQWRPSAKPATPSPSWSRVLSTGPG